jgi:hypothetical protein
MGLSRHARTESIDDGELVKLKHNIGKSQKRAHAEHHSTGDWNFDNANWQLNSTTYHGAPSSLHFLDANKTFVKVTTVPIASVKQGSFVAWLYANNATQAIISIFLRWQDANNHYRVDIVCGTTFEHYIVKIKAGVTTFLKSGTVNWLPVSTWGKVRISWWDDTVGLVIRVEYWNGSVWVKIIDDGYDNENLWQTIGGRIGIGHDTARALYWFIDDIEIYQTV